MMIFSVEESDVQECLKECSNRLVGKFIYIWKTNSTL